MTGPLTVALDAMGGDHAPRETVAGAVEAAATGAVRVLLCGPERVLLDELIDTQNGRQIGRLLSRHTGAAAYILSRETARLLLSWPELWSLPVDHMLFNPNNSPLIGALRPYQLTPAIARQSEAVGGKTDIEEWRTGMRTFGVQYLKRELVRAYYELRLLPSQIASFARRRADLVRVEASRNVVSLH